jgi:hypothetical protein
MTGPGAVVVVVCATSTVVFHGQAVESTEGPRTAKTLTSLDRGTRSEIAGRWGVLQAGWAGILHQSTTQDPTTSMVATYIETGLDCRWRRAARRPARRRGRTTPRRQATSTSGHEGEFGDQSPFVRVSWGQPPCGPASSLLAGFQNAEVMRSEPAGSRGGRQDRSGQELGSRAAFGRDLIHVPTSWPPGLDGRASVLRLHHDSWGEHAGQQAGGRKDPPLDPLLNHGDGWVVTDRADDR